MFRFSVVFDKRKYKQPFTMECYSVFAQHSLVYLLTESHDLNSRAMVMIVPVYESEPP